jgi:excisionase family DNA binding protein
MKKSEAAKFLDISEKTLERLVKNGEISSKLEKGKTRDVVVFDDEELKAFKEKRESSKHRPAFSSSNDSAAQDSLSLIPTKADNIDRQNQTLEFLEVFKTALTNQTVTVPIADKVLLTVRDCQLLTGLSEQTIRDAIRAGTLKGKVIGRGYKVKRSDLNAFIDSL